MNNLIVMYLIELVLVIASLFVLKKYIDHKQITYKELLTSWSHFGVIQGTMYSFFALSVLVISMYGNV